MSTMTTEIAHRFAQNLLHDIGMNNMREVIARNAVEPNLAICHSHDFCDANMPMLDAFQEIFGVDLNVDEPFHCILWGEAWSHAVKIFPLYVAAN